MHRRFATIVARGRTDQLFSRLLLRSYAVDSDIDQLRSVDNFLLRWERFNEIIARHLKALEAITKD